MLKQDRNNEKEVCMSMLEDKDPVFLKNTIKMILEWDRESYSKSIIHIHGNNDHTIPIRNVRYNYLVENGSHMMVLTRGKELNDLLNKLLGE